MMYLSHLLINIGENPDKPRPGRLWLRNMYRVHQRLCMAFPSAPRKEADPEFLQPYRRDDFPQAMPPPQYVHSRRLTDAGFLFRIDPLHNGRAAILVQSTIAPDWEYAFKNARYLLAAEPETKTYDPTLEPGMQHRFRLLANPTRKVETKTGPDGKKSKGKRVPVKEDKVYEWLCRKLKGAELPGEEHLLIQRGYVHFSKGTHEDSGKNARLFSVRFEGMLTVRDPAALRQAVIAGIGTAKGFGFGLLSLAAAKDAG